MTRNVLLVCALGLTTAAALGQAPTTRPAAGATTRPAGEAPARPAAGTPVTAASAKSVLDFTLPDIAGQDTPLAKYKGNVVLIVNVASKCGLTPQYEQLQALHEKYAGRGLRIVAFPANNFRNQEPGTNAEIAEFCRAKYGVGFDVFAKISVAGEDQHELYRYLTAERPQGTGGEIKWNFTKFLVGRDGQLLARFEPKVKPDDPAVIAAIEAALGGPAEAQQPK